MEMPDKIKFGIIGCSQIAKKSVLPAINASENSEITFIGSRSLEKAKSFSKFFKCNDYGSYDDVINSKDIDAIYVSLPIGLQQKWISKAAKNKKHIICEKSSTDSYPSAKKMVLDCKQNHVRLMEGLMFRFHPQHSKVKQIISKNQLGDVFSFHGNYGFPMPSKNNIRLKNKLGGGVLNDAGCYPVCASRIIFKSEPIKVFCNLFKKTNLSVDLKFTGCLVFPENKIATMNVGYGMHFQSTYDLWGNKGQIHLHRAYNVPPNEKTIISIKTKKSSRIEINPSNHYKIMIDIFCQELKGKKYHVFNFEEDLINQAKIMEALRLSHKENRVVKINEIK
jgi:xylose dehydrogenase (NAD/NADP)